MMDYQDNPNAESEQFEGPPSELFDLLADRALFGLEEQETETLEALSAHHAWVREDCMDEVAAMVAAENLADAEPLPADVAARISSGVHAAIDRERAATPAVVARIEPAAASPETSTAPTAGPVAWMGWVAAAAAIAVAVMVADPSASSSVQPQNREQLVAWIDQHPTAVAWDWAPGIVQGDEDATGMVTFDPASQEGYMLIKGLEPNDPRFQQYQLWIWDQDREPDPDNPTPLADNVHPVDGGVFDVNDAGEAVIPIEAKLVIGRPYLFAVTVERPGGVAKSGKEQVPIMAQKPSDA